MSFFKLYGKTKVKSLIDGIGESIVKFDPEGATEAAIAEIEEKFDELNLTFSKSKQRWLKEQSEAVAIATLYDQRVSAAEHLQEDPDKAAALEKLLILLESMQPDVEREKQEADDAKTEMNDLESLVTLYSDKLKFARKTVERAKEAMLKADRKKELAKESENAARMVAGLTGATTGLSSALDHMNTLADTANLEADAATRKANLLKPVKDEEDPDIKAAMLAVSGKATPASSIADRLAALKVKS